MMNDPLFCEYHTSWQISEFSSTTGDQLLRNLLFLEEMANKWLNDASTIEILKLSSKPFTVQIINNVNAIVTMNDGNQQTQPAMEEMAG